MNKNSTPIIKDCSVLHLKLERSISVSRLHSPMSLHLFVPLLKVSVVMYGVHSSVLLYEGKVITLALPVDIKRPDLVLTLTANRREVNDKHQLHVVVLVELLVVTVPSVRHAHLLLSVGLLLTVLLHSLWRVSLTWHSAHRLRIALRLAGVAVVAT